MKKYDWSRLNHLQIGKYAEYFTKMEFLLYGFDVYNTEVDDHGIDFVIRKDPDKYYDIQVKSLRFSTTNYIFIPKDKFHLKANLIAAVVLFTNNQEPMIYLIKSDRWKNPDSVFVDRDYEGKKSKPEWGINISKKNLQILEDYKFEKTVGEI